MHCAQCTQNTTEHGRALASNMMVIRLGHLPFFSYESLHQRQKIHNFVSSMQYNAHISLLRVVVLRSVSGMFCLPRKLFFIALSLDF